VGSLLHVFALVVLDNHALFAVFDVLPICFKVDIKKVIASKHELCRRGMVGGVDSCAHAERNCRQDTDPAIGQVVLAAKVLGAYHVMNCLMRPLHHSVRLGNSHCDRPSYDAVVLEEVDDLTHEFVAAVHDNLGWPLLLVSRVTKSRLGRCHGRDFSRSREQFFEFKMNYAQKRSRF
jgi:hypothetical protein